MSWRESPRYTAIFEDGGCYDDKTLEQAELYHTLERCFVLLVKLERKNPFERDIEILLDSINKQLIDLEINNERLMALNEASQEPLLTGYRVARQLSPISLGELKNLPTKLDDPWEQGGLLKGVL